MEQPEIFDCVEMKDRIQAERLEERRRIGEREQRRRFLRWLEDSDDPSAQWWRRVSRRVADA